MSTTASSDKEIHLLAFDIPIPVNYGGAIDIYYKIKALHQAGVGIHLHCFQYGRKPAPDLETYCLSVSYYPRRFSPFHFCRQKPYIVRSRTSDVLLRQLSDIKIPILFEGLHSCYYLDHPDLKHHHKIVRTHNIEHDYYSNLARVEKNRWKRLYFSREARKLKRFEKILSHADGIAAISNKDAQHFAGIYKNTPIDTISAFHPFNQVEYHPEQGSYALYHGSLEVGENNQAALFLINEVFSKTNIPLIIAGNKPSQELVDSVNEHDHVELRTGLSTEAIYKLVRDAQVNILPTFQATGIKLKLLVSLYIGRHCIVNFPMVESTGLESMCHIKDTAAEMKACLTDLMATPYTIEEASKRQQVFEQGGYCNSVNVTKLIRMLFP